MAQQIRDGAPQLDHVKYNNIIYLLANIPQLLIRSY